MPVVLTFILVLLSSAILLAIAISTLMAYGLLTPPRMTDGKALYVLKRISPEDLHIPYETVRYLVIDEQTTHKLAIAGWWMPAEMSSDRTVVFLHGYGDAKVGAIAWAPVWRSLGWNVLAIDLRAHGESAGKYCTAGWFERHDVTQVIDQAIAARPGQTRRIALFGVSLGAATAVATALLRDDVAALVLESPVADFDAAVANHAALLGSPVMLHPLAVWFARLISGARPDLLRPVDLIPKLSMPIMLIQSDRDVLIDAAQHRMLVEAIPKRTTTKIWNVDAEHVLALSVDPWQYAAELRGFLANAGLSDAGADRGNPNSLNSSPGTVATDGPASV